MPREPLPADLRSNGYAIASLGMDQRPETAALIGQCLMHWPSIELQMALLLGVLLNTTNEAAVAVSVSLRMNRVRQDAIDAAAQATLDDRTLRLCRAISKFAESIEKQRNELAHGCFGTMDAIPDGVLWIEHKHIAKFMMDFWNKIEHSTSSGPPVMSSLEERAEIYQRNRDHIFVYRKQHMGDLLSEINALWRVLGSFIYFLRNSRPRDIYDKLREEPHVKADLSKVRGRV